jgi:type II secretory pathway component PulC
MKDNLYPEERLLRLIKKGQNKEIPEEKPAVVPGPKAKMRFLPALAIGKYRKFINTPKIILTAFILVSIYLAFAIIYSFTDPKINNSPKINTYEKDAEQTKEPKQQTPPIEYYKANISGRQIFGTSNLDSSGVPAVAAETDSIKDINLVGIIQGDNPQAVIEDKKTNRTSYVSKGQCIGEFKVEDIQQGKIIINYRGQKLELYL